MIRSLAVIAIAVSGAMTAPAFAQEVGVVTMFHRWADEASRAPLTRAFDVCKETLPGLELRESFVPSDQYEVQLPVQLSSNTPPDIYGLWPGGRAVFQAQAGNILDITEHWHASIGANYAPSMTESVTETDGNIYVVPFDTIPNGFLYSTEAFAEAGIDAPPQTWDELMAAAEDLHGAGYTPFVVGALRGWEPMFWFDYLILRTAGSEFRERLMWGKESYLDPKVVAAMEMWKDLLDKGYFKVILSGSWAEMTTDIITGGSAMELMGPWAMNAFLQADMEPDIDFGFFQFPEIDPAIPPATEGAFQGWAASGKGGNTAGAIRLLECLASKEAQQAQADGSTNLTANPNVPPETYSEDLRDILQQMTVITAFPFHQNMELATLPPIVEVAKRELARFLDQPESYMDVLQAIEDRANTVFE